MNLFEYYFLEKNKNICENISVTNVETLNKHTYDFEGIWISGR